MSENQVQDPMEVLVRSREIPELPFKGSIVYEGVSVSATVHGEYRAGHVSDIRGNDIPFSENLDCSVNIDSNNIRNEHVFADDVAITFSDLISLWSQIVEDDYNSYILYERDGSEYVMSLDFSFVYNMSPEDASTSFICCERSSYDSIPESAPKRRITGKFFDLSEGRYHEDEDLIEFRKSSFWTTFIGHDFSLELVLDDIENVYDLYELNDTGLVDEDQHSSVGEYCSAEISVSNGDYVIKCDHSEGPVTFRIPLNKFGKLPDWCENRVDIDTLVNHLEEGESIMAEVKTCDKSSDSEWLSELEDKELVALK